MDNYLKIAAIALMLVLTATFLDIRYSSVDAQSAPSTQSGDALWHLPKFGHQGWFIHANNGRVRVCNVSQASVVGDRPGPRCSNWE